jgi:hypothetical protein
MDGAHRRLSAENIRGDDQREIDEVVVPRGHVIGDWTDCDV